MEAAEEKMKPSRNPPTPINDISDKRSPINPKDSMIKSCDDYREEYRL